MSHPDPLCCCPWAGLCAQRAADHGADAWVEVSPPAGPHPALLAVTHVAEKGHKRVVGKHSETLLCVIETNPLSDEDQIFYSHFLILLSPQVWAGVSPS